MDEESVIDRDALKQLLRHPGFLELQKVLRQREAHLGTHLLNANRCSIDEVRLIQGQATVLRFLSDEDLERVEDWLNLDVR